MTPADLPKQPHPWLSYIRVGKLLYYSLVLFVLESWVYFIFLKKAYLAGNGFWILFWFAFFLFSFLHIYLVIMDGWSRFQNYKRAKDQYFMHGFDPRIAYLYMGSKCQRAASLVAADELGLSKEVEKYYDEQGVKWFHFIPYFMVKDPLFLLRKTFWSRTFLEKAYTPQFDYRKMNLEWGM